MSAQPQSKRQQSAKPAIQVMPQAQPPYSQETEEAVLGAILANPEAFFTCSSFLTGESFYILRNQYIWQAMEAISKRNEPIDYLTVQAQLRDSKQFEEVGGAAYLTHLINAAPTSTNAEVYGRVVQRAYIRRRLLVAGDEIKALALQTDEHIETIITEVNAAVAKATNQKIGEQQAHISAAVHDYWTQLERRMTGEDTPGIPTGLTELDELTGGVHKGELIIVAGPTGVGKTSFGTGIAKNGARLGQRVAYFTKEMNRLELTQRLISSEIGVSTQWLKQGKLSQKEWALFVEAAPRLAKLPFWIVDDISPMTPLKIRRRIARLQYESGIDLVVIDGLWLMHSDTKFTDKAGENNDITEQLAQMTKDLNISIVLLHQMNREIFRRKKHVPNLADVREGGEMSANVVMLLTRPSQFDPHAYDTSTHCYVVKGRDSNTGMVKLGFSKAHSSYKDLGK